jgi:hypothetical protein
MDERVAFLARLATTSPLREALSARRRFSTARSDNEPRLATMLPAKAAFLMFAWLGRKTRYLACLVFVTAGAATRSL